MTDPTGETKERDRQIAANESTRQTISSIRVSGWAIAITVIVIAAAAFLWVMIHSN